MARARTASVSTAFVGVAGNNRLSRSEEHTSELQSQSNLVCRLLLEKKKNKRMQQRHLTGVERASELGRLSFFFSAVNFSALDSFAQRSLDRWQDSIAPFCILLPLLL